jgi:hypothetical protein
MNRFPTVKPKEPRMITTIKKFAARAACIAMLAVPFIASAADHIAI